MNTCEVCAVLPSNDPLFETSKWTVTLAADQGYLGRCYVTLKNHKGDMADLTTEEWLEFAEIVKRFEGSVRRAFGAKLFNWSCLMNNAFQVEPPLPHVHWHVRPRYESPVMVSGVEFKDRFFGHHYDRDQSSKVNDTVFGRIKAEIQANL